MDKHKYGRSFQIMLEHFLDNSLDLLRHSPDDFHSRYGNNWLQELNVLNQLRTGKDIEAYDSTNALSHVELQGLLNSNEGENDEERVGYVCQYFLHYGGLGQTSFTRATRLDTFDVCLASIMQMAMVEPKTAFARLVHLAEVLMPHGFPEWDKTVKDPAIAPALRKREEKVWNTLADLYPLGRKARSTAMNQRFGMLLYSIYFAHLIETGELDGPVSHPSVKAQQSMQSNMQILIEARSAANATTQTKMKPSRTTKPANPAKQKTLNQT